MAQKWFFQTYLKINENKSNETNAISKLIFEDIKQEGK